MSEKTMKAQWNDVELASSRDTIVVEGNHYFPPDSINWGHLEASDHKTRCPWKGQASYYHVVAEGGQNPNAAWTYPDPSAAAREIQDYVAFWHGVKVKASD